MFAFVAGTWLQGTRRRLPGGSKISWTAVPRAGFETGREDPVYDPEFGAFGRTLRWLCPYLVRVKYGSLPRPENHTACRSLTAAVLEMVEKEDPGGSIR